MLSIIFGTIACSCLCGFWGAATSGIFLVSLISVTLVCQRFTLWGDLSFSGGSLSVLMVLLSLMLCFFSLISTPSEKDVKYIFWILIIGLILVSAFSIGNVIMFYVLFEASLIPTLMLIIGWGYQPERLQAGTYMMIYTVAASLPLLALLIFRCYECSSGSIAMMSSIPYSGAGVLVFVGYAAFLVKLPMYSFHLWLPKAHVEAPLAGSMLLAGILLKLGGYGLFQMNKVFFFAGGNLPVFILCAISMWGGLLSSLMCLRQVDMKALVAYSSVGHMGIVAAGLMLDRSWGVMSATVIMFAHGLSSSALFCLAYFTYVKSHSRSLSYLGGILSLYPVVSLFWFGFCCINMAAPLTLNLLGELLIVPCLWSVSIFMVIVMALMVFVSAAYNMFLYTSINHGAPSTFLVPGKPLRSFEMLSLVVHSAPLLLLLKSEIFI
uniref:NADH-ubiquinone oxidoreductase chain 4 n=1 Tax=Onchidella celtica TaxID=36933 RepID=B3DFD4_9EUPU|nr:NADH dehydrogenase subunit 4 [Onchidella celtica]ACE62821.1 NADH dehydrogenase subunit 4 [Onchidella celtica]